MITENETNSVRHEEPVSFEVGLQPLVEGPFYSETGEEIYGAGQFVLAGFYVEVDGHRQVLLDKPGILPALLDGRRAFYRRLERPWVNLAVAQPDTNGSKKSTNAA